MSRIFAIDPGNEKSAYVIMDTLTYEPYLFGKVPNKDMCDIIFNKGCLETSKMKVIIENVASYGLPVGREVFETCIWIGRFTECAETYFHEHVEYIYRMDEKMTICHDSKAKDTNIRRALIDRFAKHDLRQGKGTRNNPDWFYGFHSDVWSAYAVGVTWLDMQKEKNK